MSKSFVSSMPFADMAFLSSARVVLMPSIEISTKSADRAFLQ